ncbi:uncharacterized protein LOC142632519 [Castanea sativa]|uniref:uncharacterized protein LOC142632519 n=1 Tax=Castanea sativa TaxID=21020 RepID=UPI003F64C23D
MDEPKEDETRLIVVKQKKEPTYCITIEEDEEKNGKNEWYIDILQYLKNGTYPSSVDKNDQLTIRRLSTNYIICGERLYRRSYAGIYLLCVTVKEVQQIIEEVHESSYGPHMNAHMLLRKIMRQGYYWTTMEVDCSAHVRKCHQCEVHGGLKHMPPMPLHTMTSLWPFSTWGIDIIGKIHLTAFNDHEFILVAIDYFTKWVEAASHKKSTKNYKDWHLQLPYALWGYRTSIRSSTGATPYSLVYGMEVVLPIEMGVCTLRTVLESEIPEADWLQSRYDQLCMLDEKRLKTLYDIQGYQRRLRKAFDKKVRPRDLKLGDLVLKKIQAPVQDANRKFKQNWADPYIIKQIYSREAVRLMDLYANFFTEPTNMDQLKKYHV